MTRAGWIAVLLSLLMIGTAAGLFFYLFELKEKEVSFGYSPEARLNDYLAARRFLKRMGIPAADRDMITPASKMPDDTDVLLMLSRRLTLNAKSQAVIMDWVEAGGHLILPGRQDLQIDGLEDILDKVNEIDIKDDPLFDALGLQSLYVDMESDEFREFDAFGVDIPGSDNFVWAKFNPRYRLKQEGERFESLAGDDYGDLLLSGRFGDGRVTVLSDHRVLHNRQIDEQDHALLLWHLVNLHGVPGKAWIIAEDDMPALPAWLWQHAREFMLSLLILGVLLLYRASRRFGPLADVPPPVRRSLLEHIQASGQFLWQYRHFERLLEGMRHTLKHELAIKHPGMQGLGASETARRLAEFVPMPEEDIRHVLGSIRIRTPEEFTQTVRLYEALRKQL